MISIAFVWHYFDQLHCKQLYDGLLQVEVNLEWFSAQCALLAVYKNAAKKGEQKPDAFVNFIIFCSSPELCISNEFARLFSFLLGRIFSIVYFTQSVETESKISQNSGKTVLLDLHLECTTWRVKNPYSNKIRIGGNLEKCKNLNPENFVCQILIFLHFMACRDVSK